MNPLDEVELVPRIFGELHLHLVGLPGGVSLEIKVKEV
jgi:hypothetical protein